MSRYGSRQSRMHTAKPCVASKPQYTVHAHTHEIGSNDHMDPMGENDLWGNPLIIVEARGPENCKLRSISDEKVTPQQLWAGWLAYGYLMQSEGGLTLAQNQLLTETLGKATLKQ